MKKFYLLIVLGSLVTLAACEMTGTAYPVNKAAMKRQITEFKYTSAGIGRGPVKATMSDGEVLQGEFTTVSSGMTQTYSHATAQGFSNGTAFDNKGNTAYGSGTSTATANGASTTYGGTGGGVANLIGNQGTAMKCTYSLNSLTGGGVAD